MSRLVAAFLAAWPVALSLLDGAPACAADRGSDSEPGRALYLRYCGACHGPEGKGDGLAGTFLRPKPADLTVIARNNGGVFPWERVRAAIDGSTRVGPHGEGSMPVWGEILAEEAGWDMTRRAEVRSKLLLITDHVRSLQSP